MLFKALQYLISGVVAEPQHVAIDRIETTKVDIFYLSSPKGELGRLLGRQGRTVEAMRDVLSAIARKLEKEAIIDVIEQRLDLTGSSSDEDRQRRPRPPYQQDRRRPRQRRAGPPRTGGPRPQQRGSGRPPRAREKNGTGSTTPPQKPTS
jgi:predicted RNA-binding protein YlqC (UPF0109 family)